MLGSDFFFVSQSEDDSSIRVGQFRNAIALTVDPAGNLYVLDGDKNELVKMDSSGEVIRSTGGYGWSETAFDQPSDLASPNGLDVYVADLGNHRIQHFDRNLNYVSTLFLRENDDADRRFGYPRSVAISHLGDLFLVDGENTRIVKIVNNNTFDRAFGGQGSGAGQLQNPSRVRVSLSDLVYVQDVNTLKVFDTFGNYVRTVGEGIFSEVKTFVVGPGMVVVLDSCTLRILDEDGSVERDVALAAAGVQGGDCDIRDLAIRGRTIYLLDKHQVWLRSLPVIERQQH